MEQPRCPTTDEWINQVWYLFTMECYSAKKENEILSFADKWNWRTSSYVKIVMFLKPKIACFLSYIEYRHNTNASNFI
jgi:hypothetical protein